MKKTLPAISAALLLAFQPIAQAGKRDAANEPWRAVDHYNVRWESPSGTSAGSMPIGNGDLGANVWVDSSGAITFYLSKTDAVSELGRLLKIGRVTVRMYPNLLTTGRFTQTLDLAQGIIRFEGRTADRQNVRLDFRVDANRPIVRLEGSASQSVRLEVTSQMWRRERRPLEGKERVSAYGMSQAPFPLYSEPDRYYDNGRADLVWAHRNESSIYRFTLRQQSLDDFDAPDPLMHNMFGALVRADGCRRTSDSTLSSTHPSRRISVAVAVAHTHSVQNPDQWVSELTQRSDSLLDPRHATRAKAAHQHWWNRFWERHYLFVGRPGADSSKAETRIVTEGYILQRYVNACAGRGELPIKFNGSIFTVDLHWNMGQGKQGYDADYRDWGGPYWWQNTRLPYAAMYYSGDIEMMNPLWKMYLDAMPLARHRTEKHFGHPGIFMPETFYFWGCYAPDNYGWERPDTLKTGIPTSPYIRLYYQGTLEVAAMMLQRYEFAPDASFLRDTLLPFATEALIFYDRHYPLDSTGKMHIQPAQSLETYFEGVINPAPDIAALSWLLSGLARLDERLPDSTAALVVRMQRALPELPRRQTETGEILAAGTHLGPRTNVEKPELYSVFPYRLFGVGLPELELARRTYAQRAVKEHWGWQQDAIFAANLGLTDEARRIVTTNFSRKHDGSRFPGFYGPNYDWVPDQDHPNVTSRALQEMAVQYVRDTVYLLPAWPLDWPLECKVHLPRNTTLTLKYTPDQGLQIIDSGNSRLRMIDCTTDTVIQPNPKSKKNNIPKIK